MSKRDFQRWQGFVEESKRYMNHPSCWNEWDWKGVDYPDGWTTRDKRHAALKFWLAFPRAWVRFHWFALRDLVRGSVHV